jgi:hypothetical protein
MSEPNERRTETRIEEAMRGRENRAADQRSTTVPIEEKRRMQRRLAQLKTTIGDNGLGPAMATPSENSAADFVVTLHEQGHRTGTLLLVSAGSLLVGAGLMWFAVGNPQPAPAPTVDTLPAIANSNPLPSTSEPVSTSVKTAPPAIPLPPPPEQEAIALLERWRQAWENRDVETYLNAYDPTFAPKGQSHARWTASRRTKLGAQSRISIKVREIRTHPISPQRIEVSFLQDYESGVYREVGRAKTLELQRNGTGWRIVGELQSSRIGQP